VPLWVWIYLGIVAVLGSVVFYQVVRIIWDEYRA
jgi:hypothetical protein